MKHPLGPYALSFGAVLLLWQAAVSIIAPPPYMLPSPLSVLRALHDNAPLLLHHSGITATAVLLAFVIAVALGLLLGCLLYFQAPLRRALLPLLLLSQIMPVFALAPLLVLWFGYGMGAKTVMAILVCFFPLVLVIIGAFRATPQPYADFAASVATPFWPLLRRVLLPAALPGIAPAIKLAAVYAPLGAILGEWVGAEGGLGYLMLLSAGRLKIELLFAALVCLAGITALLYISVSATLKKLQPWHTDVQFQ